MRPELEELTESILAEYKRLCGSGLEDYLKVVGSGGSFYDVYAFAKNAGHNMEMAIIDQWDFDGEVYYETIKEILSGVSGAYYDDISKIYDVVQTNINLASGHKIKSVSAGLPKLDVDDLANEMKNKLITQLEGKIQTLGCKIVDYNEKANMNLLSNAGFEIVITRKYDNVGLRRNTKYSERCAFCLERVGTYRFKTTREASNSGIFARHPGCGCVIDYKSTRTGTVTKNVQNFNKANPSVKQTRESRKEEVAHNLEMFEKAKKFYNSPEGRKAMENIRNKK